MISQQSIDVYFDIEKFLLMSTFYSGKQFEWAVQLRMCHTVFVSKFNGNFKYFNETKRMNTETFTEEFRRYSLLE